jgi:hypothetical protein
MDEAANNAISEPLDLVRLCLGEYVKYSLKEFEEFHRLMLRQACLHQAAR